MALHLSMNEKQILSDKSSNFNIIESFVHRCLSIRDQRLTSIPARAIEARFGGASEDYVSIFDWWRVSGTV